jgi:fructokinase
MGTIIVGIGELLWDMLPGGKQLGGAPANVARHVCSLGETGTVVSRVGADSLGRELLARFHAAGWSREFIQIDGVRSTGTVSVALDANGSPSFTINEAAAWDFIAYTPALDSLASRAQAVCYGTLAQRSQVSRRAIGRFLKRMAPSTIRLLDLNLRERFYSAQTVEDSLRAANVAKLNHDELGVVRTMLSLPGDDEEAMAALAARFELRAVALTRGAQGSLLYADGAFSIHPGFRVPVVDTVGAGDAFAAALVVGLLRGDAPDRINRSANRAAAFVCAHGGATADLSRLVEE